MHTNHTDMDAILEELNDEKAHVLIPAMIYCGLLMLFGTTGNLMVVYFYGFRSKTTSATCFILALALFDLIACIFGIPIEITDMTMFFVFTNTPACRLLAFVNHFAIIASAFTLCFIAVDRYKRICKPFDRQMTVKKARLVCGICALLGLLLGWPSIALYTVEMVPINTTYHDEKIYIEGYDCTSVKDKAYEPYAWAYSVVQFIGFVGITIALIVCYFLVGRQLFKHKKFRFYVAQKGLRRTASGNVTTMTTSNTDYVDNESSDPGPYSIPITSIPEEDEDELEEVEYDGPDDDPPMIQETIPDLRELLELDARGLPDVDESRPPSALREFLSDRPMNSSRLSRPNSVLTDTSSRSKGSIMTVKSVVICDASENQIFDIEPRDRSSATHWRPRSVMSDSTWSNSITRPGSSCSLQLNSRPSSMMSNHSDTYEDKDIDDEVTPRLMAARAQLFSANSKSSMKNGLKRSRSESSAEPMPVKRTSSNKSITGKQPSKIVGIRRTASEGGGLRRTGSNSSIKGLRRTASTDSNKINTDTDNLKDMRMKLLDINTVKYTVIMLVIAIVFICSCVPYLVLAVWRVYADDNLVYNFSNAQLVWFQIGIRSYFLNCAINPFIYGFFNSQFRTYFYDKWCSCCSREDEADEIFNQKMDTPR